MKKIFSLFSITLVLISSAMAQNYTADTKDSSLEWEAFKLIGSSHQGTVQLLSGELSVKDGIPVSGSFVIDMSSITCTDLSGTMADKLVSHLKSDDFFGVENFPKSTLTILSAKEEGSQLLITAKVVIKGVENTVEFPATLKGKVFSAHLTLDRTKFGVRYGSTSFFDDLGDKAIKNDFTIKANIKLRK